MKNVGSKEDISSVLEELHELEHQSTDDPIVKEILQIDLRSFTMAQLIVQNAKERMNLKEEAIEMMHRLDSLSKKLETENPKSFSKMADHISESLLDLMYVEMENDMLSLRLGKYLNDSDPDSDEK